MIRFRNPGTQYSTQVQVMKQLYTALHEQEYFTLEDMASVIAKGRLMTAYGYAGDDALRLSNTEQESMNSVLMNSKMYAEVFRMLGWVAPYSDEASYPLVFTYIGIHVALSKENSSKLYEQCVLGINTPTQLTKRMHYNEKVRFFKCALRSFIDLDGIMYKHELCLGPMSVNDEDEEAYQQMIHYIKSIRGNYLQLKAEFEKLAQNLGMKPTPVDNCTRLPIALMKTCNWIESVQNYSLYGKNMSCLQITSHGISVYKSIKDMYDLRLDKYIELNTQIQEAMIRLGTYSMLSRAGYDISAVDNLVLSDKKLCKSVIGDKDLLFSPSQTLKRNQVEKALGTLRTIHRLETYQYGNVYNDNAREYEMTIQRLELNIPKNVATNLLVSPEDMKFLSHVNQLLISEKKSSAIVDKLFEYHVHSKQNIFYPLIATLFRIMGFQCNFSRYGDNSARWDAIIEDAQRSIPIEIKSPTEELNISIKAIRQALENKIILLSRKTYLTTPNTTTLVIGYYMPNKRAEVSRLISDFKETYGYSVGVIDFKSLLSIGVSILVDGKGFEKEKLYNLEGLISANI